MRGTEASDGVKHKVAVYSTNTMSLNVWVWYDAVLPHLAIKHERRQREWKWPTGYFK